MRNVHLAVVGALAVAVVGSVVAEDTKPVTPCSPPEFRQFDFWLGDWNVNDAAGALVGTNRVTSEMGACVLHEHWKGIRGVAGESFNIYDAPSRRWHQTWVDASGVLLLLDGGISGGKMILEGNGRGSRGEPARHRISWERLPDGRVRQIWTTTTDSGKTWTTAFDGYYTKMK